MASHADFDSAHDMLDLDIHSLRQFIELFPNEGLSKVLTGYLSSGISKFPLREERPESPDLTEGGVALDHNVPLTQEDCLLLMTEGILEAKDSPLAHCLIADYYLFLEEYESAVETARKGLQLTADESRKTDLSFQRVKDALNTTLATALIYYQSPKNHGEAKEIFASILKRKPDFTSALIGEGLILEEEEEYAAAIDFLSKALAQDESNGRIGAEVAWCQALNGDYKTGLAGLQKYLEYPQMDPTKQRGKELRSQTLYRIGVCIWELDPSAAARKDRQGAYAKFLASIKSNPNFAPAYTSLGIFYEDYRKDRKRARQCFQKAFELSPSELVAAERLARSFADQGDWDIVEVISQRAVDSGKIRPTPGSKSKKGVSWPFSALGVVQMNRQEYTKSIVSFLSALRISPDDYHSYVGLGESYHNSGRFNSAARVFNYAENPTDGVVMKESGEKWFTKYMLANVNRELSEFNEAITEYEEVLRDRPKEFGVLIALLQTLVDSGWRRIESGFFGGAADSAIRAVEVGAIIAEDKPDPFNLWKALGDAMAIFTWIQEKTSSAPLAAIQKLLRTGCDVKDYDKYEEMDGVGSSKLDSLLDHEDDMSKRLAAIIHAAILTNKRAIISCANDIHAQAVAWYNLGWMEYRAHVCLEQEASTAEGKPAKNKFLRAAIQCFKRAIELEAGNSEFWNSLGVVTTPLNPKVAQHSFIRSIHLNERNVRGWTNLGALYLLQNDLELAHQAFSRAQSTDPDYAHAWVGEGLVALLFGDTNEALSHFTHAFELSDSASLLTKRQYTVSTFDYLITSADASNDITRLIQPLFALHKLVYQQPHAISYRHLAALFMERVGNHDGAISALTSLCEAAEAEYETSESAASLSRFAQAKADLARNYLAVHNYSSAVEEAEMALDLTSDEDSVKGVMTASGLQKMQLSARLTAGLSHYYLNDMDASISFFRTALEESNSSPDIICLLAEVLWAKGGEKERGVAKDQLFTCIENHPDHVGAVVLLGAIAAMDEDVETMEAIKDELNSLRTKSGLDGHQRARVAKVLDAVAALSGGDEEKESEVKRSIMLAPWHSVGWSELASSTEDDFAATMALQTASRSVPPSGDLEAVELGKAFAGTGTVGDAQRAVVLAPWVKEGWVALAEAVA